MALARKDFGPVARARPDFENCHAGLQPPKRETLLGMAINIAHDVLR